MGLDNGICFKDELEIPFDLPVFVKLDDKDICYWRKCWGVRNAIKATLHMARDEYEYELDEEDFPALIKTLEYFLDEKKWKDEADSIWEYKNYIQHHCQNIKNLLWAWDYKSKHPEVSIIFYDSY